MDAPVVSRSVTRVAWCEGTFATRCGIGLSRVLLALALFSCDSNEAGAPSLIPPDEPGCVGASCGGEADDAGAQASASQATDGGLPPLDDDGVSSLGAAPACGDVVQIGGPPPTAVHLMLDSSGSMAEASGAADNTKWQELEQAIRRFVAEREADALSLGVQFFPLTVSGSSVFCTSHDDCGPLGGPCFLSTCSTSEALTVCRTDADCPGLPASNPCVDFGLCRDADPDAPIGCLLGTTCAGGLGPCEDFERTCLNATECNAGAYAVPAVELDELSRSWLAIEPLLTARPVQGLSPLAPALQGALDHAVSWAETRPLESVAVVMMTDGLSTACDESSLAAVTASVAAAAPRIRTFVIASSDAPSDGALMATPAPAPDAGTTATPGRIDQLNAIAAAGGTYRALWVEPGAGLADRWAGELSRVSLDCRQALEPSAELDLLHADAVLEASGAAPELLAHLASASDCARVPRGWFYAVDPAVSAPPAIELCPDLCSDLRSRPEAIVHTRVGCRAP